MHPAVSNYLLRPGTTQNPNTAVSVWGSAELGKHHSLEEPARGPLSPPLDP